MKTFKQHLNESVPTLTHVQSTTNSDGRLIKIMSDGSETPFKVNDIEDTTELVKASQEVIIDIIKDNIPLLVRPFVEADLDNWDHISQILRNWGDEPPSGYYLPVEYLDDAEVKLQKVIADGNVHPDINYNAWILEILQVLHDMLTE